MLQTLQENFYSIDHFQFHNGQTIRSLKLHYYTLGNPILNDQQEITNAILLLHNTTGSAKEWLTDELGGELFGPNQALDVSKYFLIMPDAIGFGASSKPSDGMARLFPNFRYIDIVHAHHQLLTQALGVNHLSSS